MGRRKKTDVTPIIPDQDLAEILAKNEGAIIKEKDSFRDERGLLKTVKYSFTPVGFIDWEAMIDPQFIVLNREHFLKKDTPIDIDTLSEDELIELKRKSKSKDRLILLAGLKELARVRGYTSVYTNVKDTPNGVVATCNINWIKNFESDEEIGSCGVADATPSNTNGLATQYLAAIAENRAFSRAVRNFLMIHAVADAETTFNASEYDAKPEVLKSGPQFALQKKIKENKRTFSEFQQWVVTNDLAIGGEVWNSETDIPSDQATDLLSKIGEFLK